MARHGLYHFKWKLLRDLEYQVSCQGILRKNDRIFFIHKILRSTLYNLKIISFFL